LDDPLDPAAGATPGGSRSGAGDRAAKNTAVRAAAEIVGKLATFVLFAALARSVGEQGVGVYVLAFAFLQLITIPVGMGTDPYFLRAVARDRGALERLFFDVLGLKLALAGPMIAVAVILSFALGYDGETRAVIYVLAAGVLLDLLGKTFNSVFNATERSELLGLSLVAQRILGAGLGLAALAAGLGVVAVAATYSIASGVGVVISATLLHRTTGFPRLRVAPGRWRSLATRSFPFAVQDVFNVLLFKLDAVLLSVLATEAAVGRYGAAYRLLESTLFVTWALNGAFAAMYAYLGRDSEPTIQSVFERSVKVALVVLVPAAVAMGVLSESFMTVAFGREFASGADALRLLSPVVVLLCLATLCASLIVSRRSPQTMVRITAAMVVLNAALNFALIPQLADRGSALGMLITEAAFVTVAMWVAAKEVGGIRWAPMLASPLIAGAAMVAAMLALHAVPLAALLVGGGLYLGAFVAIERRVSPQDLAFVRGLLTRRLRSSAAS
jgi:O-antigen/teichoic acid export membrane protein